MVRCCEEKVVFFVVCILAFTKTEPRAQRLPQMISIKWVFQPYFSLPLLSIRPASSSEAPRRRVYDWFPSTQARDANTPPLG